MAYDVVRPLMHEVLTMVNNAKVKDKKIDVLRISSSIPQKSNSVPTLNLKVSIAHRLHVCGVER